MIVQSDTTDYPESDGWLNILAPAKINLFLHITGRRADGYHALESLFAFADFGDVVRVRKADQLSLALTGPFADDLRAAGGEGDGNLAIKAAQALVLFAESDKAEAEIVLEKNLPVAAGIGGGSGDAAAVLLALNQLFRFSLDSDALAALALTLGADVPACLKGETAFVSGIGEKVETIEGFGPMPVLLLNPRLPLATGKVFDAYKHQSRGFAKPLKSWDNVRNSEMVDGLSRLSNDLQEPASRLVPQITDLLQLLAAQAGCRLARMSGSGATCFGLFESEPAADQAMTKIASARPQWWAQSGMLGK